MLQLGIEKSIEEQGMRSLDNWGRLTSGTKTQKAKQLFPRIEDKQAAKILAELETQKRDKKDDSRKLYSGTVVNVEPTSVSRIIGKQGSMITTIREKTNTRIQIGQNGFIWIDGKGGDIAMAQKAIEMIDQRTTTKGLTKKIEKLLEK